MGTTIGFDITADDADAASHEADDVRIHSEERITDDLGAATNIYGMIIRGHNFSASATVEAIFSADVWATIAEALDFTVQDDIMILEWDTPKDYRYVGIRIKDPENSDLYVKVGVLFIGPQLQPIINFLSPEPDIDRIDPSIVMESGAGQESSLQQETYDTWAYLFKVKGTAQYPHKYGTFLYGSGPKYGQNTAKGCFDVMFNTVGTSRALFICEDPDLSLTTTKYIRFTGWKWRAIKRSIDHWGLVVGVKEQR